VVSFKGAFIVYFLAAAVYPPVEAFGADMKGSSSERNIPSLVWGMVVLLLALFASQNLFEMLRESCTMDEVVHLPAGYTYLLKRDFRLNPEHPPLLKILCALPLLVLRPAVDFNDIHWTSASSSADHYQFGSKFLFSNDADRLLFWGRLPILLLAILLELFVFLWAQRLYGNTAGLFALGLFAFSPNIIAHSHLVTSDVGVSAFLTICFYFLWRYRRTQKQLHLCWSSLAMGAALASKFSAIVLFPVALFVLWVIQKTDSPIESQASTPRSWQKKKKPYGYSAREDDSLYQKGDFWRSLVRVDKQKVLETVVFAGIAFAAVQLSYIGSLDLTVFFKGMAQVNQNHDPSFPYYFNGNMQPGGSWYYIPASFLLKATTAFIVLLFARIVVFLERGGAGVANRCVFAAARGGLLRGDRRVCRSAWCPIPPAGFTVPHGFIRRPCAVLCPQAGGFVGSLGTAVMAHRIIGSRISPSSFLFQ
jgi:hypothetical protein